MFAVVEFNQDEGLSIVNTKWITPRKKEVFWPPYKDQNQYNRAVRKAEDVNTETWSLHPISRIFFEGDDYESASKKLRRAEFTSDLQTDDDFQPVIKRKVVPRRRFSYASSSEEERESLYPRPPLISISKRVYKSSNHVKESPSCCKLNEKVQPMSCSNSPHIVTPTDYVATPTNSFDTSSHFNGNFLDDKAVVQTLLTHIVCIKEQNKQILGLLKVKQSERVSQPHAFLDNLPVKLPLQTETDVEKLERYLASLLENVNEMVRHFSTLGGKDVASNVNRVLRCLMTDAVASKFSFFGKRNKKKAFSDLELKTVVIRSVKLSCKESTDAEIEAMVKVWLKHAPQRHHLKTLKK